MRPAAQAFSSPHSASRVPDALDSELDAFNAAFDELDLDWRWDRAVIEELAPAGVPVRHASRPERSSPAEGYPAAHRAEQLRLVAETLA